MTKVVLDKGGIGGALVETVVALTPGATPALNAALGGVFTITPAETETINATGMVNGERLTLVVVTSGTTSYTLTLGTGFKSTGTLATGTVTAKTFVLSFICVGGVLIEVSRTTAM